MAINISNLNMTEIIPQKINPPVMQNKLDPEALKEKFNMARSNGQVVDLLQLSGVSQEKLDALKNEGGVKRTGTSYGVDSFFRKDMPKMQNGDGSYTISGVKFTEDELIKAREVMKGAVSELPIGGTLDYKDYAKMSLAENAVNSFAKDNFSEEQQNVIAKAMKEYNEGLEQAQQKSLSRGTIVDNDYGELSTYYGKSQRIDQSLADELNRIKEEISKLTGQKFTKTVAGEVKGIVTTATNKDLIKNVKDTFSNIDINDKNSVDQAMEKYRELMKPAYKAAGSLMRDDSVLFNDTNDFTKMLESIKQRMSYTHIDFSV